MNKIAESITDRSTIKVSLYNVKQEFKHLKYAIKNGLYTHEQSMIYVLRLLNELKSIEWLVKIYHELYSEKYYKLKLEVEKYYDNH